MRNVTKAALATLAGTAIMVGGAAAATVTANMNVKITITNACTITTPTDMDFGTRGVLNADFDTTSTFSVTCSNGHAYTVGMNGGVSTNVSARTMVLGGEDVAYQIYRDAGHSQIWGDTAGQTAAGTGNGAAQSFTAYGRVPSQDTPTAGNYTDTVVVTVTY